MLFKIALKEQKIKEKRKKEENNKNNMCFYTSDLHKDYVDFKRIPVKCSGCTNQLPYGYCLIKAFPSLFCLNPFNLSNNL